MLVVGVEQLKTGTKKGVQTMKHTLRLNAKVEMDWSR